MKAALLCAGMVLALIAAPARGADDPAGLELFEKKIRPLLVEQCYSCHSAQAKSLKGGLKVDSRDGLLRGGDSGPAITPHKPDDSLLLKALAYTGDFYDMPPRGKLPDVVLSDVRRWIELGAPDPRVLPAAAPSAASWDDVVRERRTWWSWQPVQHPPLPQVRAAAWPRESLDYFILARLEAVGLSPAAEADFATLLRRASLVLTGLAPSVAERARFVKQLDDSATAVQAAAAAYAEAVDRLLASPQFGEHWARHWLDVVRYSETHGNEWNYELHHAWRYRDYVIRAFNDDVPYDQFVREHIAGDLLPPRWNEQEQLNEAPIGTAFYRCGEVNHDDCISLRQIGYDLVDNQLDTLTKAFQATTVACARCHDHKLDAVAQRDYYALLGILRSSRLVAHTVDAPQVNAELLQRMAAIKQALRGQLATHWQADAQNVAEYLVAAQATIGEKDAGEHELAGLDCQRLDRWVAALKAAVPPWSDLWTPWRKLAAAKSETSIAGEWQSLASEFQAERDRRAEFNRQNFETFADFRAGDWPAWQSEGHGVRAGISRAGELVVVSQGENALSAVLPAGMYSHTQSSKLNGALRSQALQQGGRKLSVQVIGRHGAAVRLVSNNCQLNYKNYRNLTSDQWQWVTLDVPDEAADLRCYVELMTMADNPKFPDQLSALGGDKQNYRLPWDEAVGDGRSYWGVTRIVAHDGSETPRDEIAHFDRLFADSGEPPASLAELPARYAAAIEKAVRRWADNQASDDDVRWIAGLLSAGLIDNRANGTPAVAALVREYRTLEAQLQAPRVVPGLADCGEGVDQPIFLRGDCLRPGDAAPRGYVQVLSSNPTKFTSTGSGRLALAEQIASEKNPLTARVMVNRVWHQLFGAGLVRTVDDFGHVGELPSHPELLDHLAGEFVREGWSVKELVRRIVLSRTFRMAAQARQVSSSVGAANVDPAVVDPENRLQHRYPARRLAAEGVRDALLGTAGELKLSLYGPSVPAYREKANADRRLFVGPLDGHGRRSVYIKATLMESPRFLSVFNFPGGKVAQGRRDQTQVPAQALAIWNDPLVAHASRAWAERLIERDDNSPAARIDHMFLHALGRQPLPEEQSRFAAAAAQLAELRKISSSHDLLGSREVWQDLAHAMFALEEFLYIP